MRRFALVCVVLVATFEVVHVHAQAPGLSRNRSGAGQTQAASTLPIRRVVLYKNGIGYFEHVGRVRGNDTVTLDFNSSQLDDALNSLTVLDLGNGRVTGVSYNSDPPVSQRLSELRLSIGD